MSDWIADVHDYSNVDDEGQGVYILGDFEPVEIGKKFTDVLPVIAGDYKIKTFKVILNGVELDVDEAVNMVFDVDTKVHIVTSDKAS